MQKTVNLWLNNDNVSEQYKEEIRSLSEKDLQDSFYKDVEFGTAGMRGLMGVGTNRLNEFTIKRAALAYAQFINSRSVNKKVAIAYDNRNNSKLFADISAKVLAKQNIEVVMYDKVMATPLLSYAVRQLDCGGGIIITASHNPKEYNGFKVYNEEGCQLITQYANEVIKNVNKLDDYLNIDINLNEEEASRISYIDNKLVDEYIETVLDSQYNLNSNDDFKIVYSSQHGAGINVIPELLEKANYNFHIVDSQATLDGDFSNTLSPNPEDKDAYIEGIKIAKEQNANIVVTSDPDADRLGVAVLHNGEYQLLNGNETTALILYYILSQKTLNQTLPKHPIVVNTIVTSDIGERICDDYNTKLFKTLTGFKYIGTLIDEEDNLDNYVFGYEESYGSLPLAIVRDKDAASATLLLCEIGAYYAAQDKTLIDLLEMIYSKYGYFHDTQESIMAPGVEGPDKIKAILEKFENETLGNKNGINLVKIEDYNKLICISENKEEKLDFEQSSVYKLFFENIGWIAIRPSGTEPKIKFYYSSTGKDAQEAQDNFEKLNDYVKSVVK